MVLTPMFVFPFFKSSIPCKQDSPPGCLWVLICLTHPESKYISCMSTVYSQFYTHLVKLCFYRIEIKKY